ncbi:hypothetical protein DM01DRAFT_1383633 [Hesseltinella vesiculosa]|uniref:Snurportin-1 n=1 Tax=Hesseltinella vesiculosa TaxID=101127 RepID=A0A1X2GH74_9FUNG|nr:hypothetical protein DM01DRAFT_1383633 [Hesseltinella vesiculosa]
MAEEAAGPIDTHKESSASQPPQPPKPPLNIATDHLKDGLSMKELAQQLDQYDHPRQSVLNRFQAPVSRQILQAERIQQALEWQRMHRNMNTNKARKLALGDLSSSDDDDDERPIYQSFATQGLKRSRDEDDDGPLDGRSIDRKFICLDRPREPDVSKKPPYAKFADKVMYAETMTEIPQNFRTDWVTMVCPVGKRCLVTAVNGQTTARARSGRIINRFQSRLPNGSISRGAGLSSDYSILDCVYEASTFTFYVLDVMCWKGYSIYDCDTDFRHFWLQTNVAQLDTPATTANQMYQFKPLLPVVTHETASLIKDIERNKYPYTVDGLLFYHRKSQYTTGTTPLVAWLPKDQLKAMFPE